jgi:N-acetylneuraminic acid mutarotase
MDMTQLAQRAILTTGAVSWTDSAGNLWLFGGSGYDAVGAIGSLNDLWKYDGTNWTWVSGDNAVNQVGVYGTKGVAAPSNVPGGRSYAVTWIDASSNLWLFGGFGYDAASTAGILNDLWKYDGTNWTWVSGGNAVDQDGLYVTKGIAAPDNVPGSRNQAISWIDSAGNLWLFGGYGIASGTTGQLNDLWKYGN